MEILIQSNMGEKGRRMLNALASTAPIPHTVVEAPSGRATVLMTYGPGDKVRKQWLAEHRARGGVTVIWDMGYFATKDFVGAMRFSANEWHPQHLMDRAPADGSRWDALRLPLRADANPKGPIILVGMGPKTRAIIDETDWESRMFVKLRKRHPGRQIIFRPKPGRPHPTLPCETDGHSPIESLLKGASLVVCRHSNVACDAVLAGVPFEASDGAARWLADKPYTPENRLEFLRRLMWFNWRPDEAAAAWGMVLKCV
jgi:hypothetical protein